MARRSKGASARRRAARIARSNAPDSNTPKENLTIEASTTETIAAAKHNRAGAGAQHNPADSARASQEIIPGVPEDATGDSARHANHPERVTFFTSPFKVSYYSTLYLKQKLRSTAGYIAQYPLALAYSVALGIVYTLLHFVSGPHIDVFRRVDAWVGWYSYWVLLGVLSSIGLGAGLHTFVLFLGPHIARVTLTAYECTHTSFAVRGPNAFLCSAAFGATQATFAGIMRKVIIESLCWGAGTAIGELPPYFIARAASATGQGDVEYQRLKRKAAAGGSLSVKDRALLSIYHLLQRFGFAGILVFAAIPNPLFDLAGITCGHFKVPFWTFFGATFIGKSIIKSSMQTAVVITAFSKEMIAVVLSFLAHVSPWVHDLAEHVLRKQAAAFGQGSTRGGGSTTGGGAGQLPSTDDVRLESSSFSLLGSMWNACISIMLIYFVISTLETFAQSYMTDVKSWGQHQLARVGSRPRMDTATVTTADGADALGSDDSDCSNCSSDSGSALR